MKKLLFALLMCLAFISCITDNQRARKYGGTETVKLKPNERFINITWKQDNLWIIVQDTTTGNYLAREKSSFGLLEGSIIIQK